MAEAPAMQAMSHLYPLNQVPLSVLMPGAYKQVPLLGIIGSPADIRIIDLKPCMASLPYALYERAVFKRDLPWLAQCNASHNPRRYAHGPEERNGQMGEILAVPCACIERIDCIILRRIGGIFYIVNHPVQYLYDCRLFCPCPLCKTIGQLLNPRVLCLRKRC